MVTGHITPLYLDVIWLQGKHKGTMNQEVYKQWTTFSAPVEIRVEENS